MLLYSFLSTKNVMYLSALILLYKLRLDVVDDDYFGQDIAMLPFTIPSYFVVRLDKLQTTRTIHADTLDAQTPLLKQGGNNLWYQYTHFQIGPCTHYIMFTSVSRYDPTITLRYHRANLKTGENSSVKFSIPKEMYVVTCNEEKDIEVVCETEDFSFRYLVNVFKKRYNLEFTTEGVRLSYEGYVETMYNQIAGRVAPFKYVARLLKMDGDITTARREPMNDQMFITRGVGYFNGERDDMASNWQDCQRGWGTYIMTNWVWIYTRGDRFAIYTLWYSDWEYYNRKTTLRVMYVYDIKEGRVILCGCMPMERLWRAMTGFSKCDLDTYGTKTKDEVYKFKLDVVTQDFSCVSESKDGTCVKACRDEYMYEKTDRTIDYEDITELMNVAEEIRYDEFACLTKTTIRYKGETIIDHGRTVVDSMVWKDDWPTGYEKRDESFFKQRFCIGSPDCDDRNGKKNSR